MQQQTNMIDDTKMTRFQLQCTSSQFPWKVQSYSCINFTNEVSFDELPISEYQKVTLLTVHSNFTKNHFINKLCFAHHFRKRWVAGQSARRPAVFLSSELALGFVGQLGHPQRGYWILKFSLLFSPPLLLCATGLHQTLSHRCWCWSSEQKSHWA